MSMKRARYTISNAKGQAGPILLVLGLVIGLMVVSFVGKYIKDTAGQAMTKGKQESDQLHKVISGRLEITSIYPTVDNLKNGFCGDPNLCELSSTNVNAAKLLLQIKNSGDNTIRASQLWGMSLYINEVPLANATGWGITQGFDTPWNPKDTKTIALNIDCGTLADRPDGLMSIRIMPSVGSLATADITCEACCKRQPDYHAECLELCK